MVKILLIRHALTDYTGKKLSGRKAGISLNDQGRKQAEEVAENLSGLPVNAIYCSPLERARQTAMPIEKAFGLTAVISEDFNEIDFGDWTDVGFEELKKDARFRQFNSFRSCTRVPGGELMQEARMRMLKGLERIKSVHDGQLVAIVSHCDMIKSVIAWYSGIHLDLMNRLSISPASVSLIELYDETARIMLVNGTGKVTA